MRRRHVAVLVALSLVAGFSLFSTLVPSLPQAYYAPCYLSCGPSASYYYNYTASITYHLFGIGAVSDHCGYRGVVSGAVAGFGPIDGSPQSCLHFV